jgi:uncharacterized protein YggE
MKRIPLLAGTVVLAALSVNAQLMPPRSSVRASGDASVSVKPDQLKLNVGVTTQAATAQEASDQNAAQVTAVIAALKKVMGATADIKTVGYSVTPLYKYPPNGGTPTLTGYTANNSVEVTTGDLSLAGKLIDTAVQAGATNVQGLRFALQDAEPARAEALRMATLQAKRHAEAIATGLSARLGSVIAAAEGGTVSVINTDVRGLGAATGGTTPTPVETGMVEVSATVTLEIELIP